MAKGWKWLPVFILLVAALAYVYRPLDGVVWSAAQISEATVGKTPVAPERFGELLRDLKRGTDSKCPADVTLVLRNGVKLTERLDPYLAVKYEKDGCGS